ncbi:hypothetical protein LXA34_17925, partial [Erwinia amylovora]|uniref:hypothetical protein n=1 Tax=Erwinia amylovora TaxID=552 RepID=UPI0020C082E7
SQRENALKISIRCKTAPSGRKNPVERPGFFQFRLRLQAANSYRVLRVSTRIETRREGSS